MKEFKMNLLFQLCLTALMATSMASTAQASIERNPASVGQDFAVEKNCGEGGICAIVCLEPGEKPRVYFGDFAVINSSGRIHRTIVDRLGYGPDEQIRQKITDLTETDHMMSDLFDNAMEHVKRTTDFQAGHSNVTFTSHS